MAESACPGGAVVVGVVVAFHPQQRVLGDLLERLAPQVASTVLVDNTPGGAAGLPADTRVIGRNVGLAAALNVGIAQAWQRGATHVLLCDQDSLPAPGMVRTLLDAEAGLLARGVPLAAVGPVYADLHSGRPRSVKLAGRWWPRHAYPRADDAPLEVLGLITAGTLIRREAFDAIGPMREELFIDRVDTEWCQRALRLGRVLYVVPAASLLQRMGEAALRLPGGVLVSSYGPERIYYQVRNLLALWRDGSLPPGIVLLGAAGVLLGIAARLLRGPRRAATASLAWRGFRDGLRGRLGALTD
ncbi:MAG: glycosyltransferase family 2 protein [Betaproteobacteria bacterium]|nr:glycosyltransferase family 2 protein [Betaproteobacteria bacterium]